MFLLLTRINGLPQNTTIKGHSQHNPLLIGRKNQVKFEMTVFSQMAIESKLLNQI